MIKPQELNRKVDKKYIRNLLERLVSIPSVNPPKNNGEIEAAELLSEEMKKLNIEAEVYEVRPGRGNVVGLMKGDKGPRLVLNGHLDVVPAACENWSSDPFKPVVKNNLLYGRGSTDMKGALAAMLGAVKLLKDNEIKLKGQLILSMVCDEEVSNLGVKHFLEKYPEADFAIIGEPTENKLVAAHRGVVRYSIKTIGRSVHAGTPGDGINAIYKMNRVISKLQEYSKKLKERTHKLLPSSSAEITLIDGGTKSNIVPDQCEIILDRRLIPGEDGDSTWREMKEILEEISTEDPDFKYELESKFLLPPGELDLNDSFLDRLKELHSQYFCLKEVPVSGFKASCEQFYFLDQGIPVVVCGPGDVNQAHTSNEYIDLDEVYTAAGFYAHTIIGLLSGQSSAV